MKILAVDLGDARTGLAICDPSELLASPLGVIWEKNPKRLLEKIVQAVQQQGAGQVVVGNPINLDGSVGSRAAQCQAFAKGLCQRLSVPVRLWDERALPFPPSATSTTPTCGGKSARRWWTRWPRSLFWKTTWPTAETTLRTRRGFCKRTRYR